MPNYGYYGRYWSFAWSDTRYPQAGLFRASCRWAVRSVFRITCTDEVSCVAYSILPEGNCCLLTTLSEFIRKALCNTAVESRNFLLPFARRLNLERTSDSLPDDWLNLWISDYPVQTSVPLMCFPEGQKELVHISTKKYSPLPHFWNCLLWLIWYHQI